MTALQQVMQALLGASADNGHDFGFFDEAYAAVRDYMSPQTFAGCISALVSAGDFFAAREDDQYELTDDVIDAANMETL